MKTGRLLALLALLLAVPLLPVCAQEEPDQDYYEEDEAAAEQEPAPAPKPAPKPAPAQYLGYSVSEISGKVDYQADGAASWKTLERKNLPKLGDRDILKTGDKSYVIFSAPGKCALRLESSSTLMLDGASKTPAAMSLVKGTVLVRCAGGQEAA
ncbi:MAG: hypothetical protein GX410_03680, partial [Elusimicrobia bacterium]|nr:hypothetical protein [Elusimicrobiota bacterium]